MLDSAAIWKNLNSPRRLFLIAGPCVIENEKLCLHCRRVAEQNLRVPGHSYVFKASFDKANRTSGNPFAGRASRWLEILARVRARDSMRC